MYQKPVGFDGLKTAFLKSLEEAFGKRDAKIARTCYDAYAGNSDHDKRAPMDQAFREFLILRLRDDVEGAGLLVRLSVDAVRFEIVSVTIPVVLLGDIFEIVTLDKCDRIFSFVEDMVEIWKEDIFFSSCKNYILRMCNDLLRRLSRAQNTVFCGRILLFLSKFFPFSERSGLNIVSEFNLDNVTEYGVDGKDLDDALEDTVEDIPIKIDYNLYCKFWSLQDFFRNPNQCYSKAQWKMFQAHAGNILEAFSSFRLEEPRLSTSNTDEREDPTEADIQEVLKMQIDSMESVSKTQTELQAEQSMRKTDHFFAKFLTNPKLLALQLSDSNFRRSVLVQFLILFQYLQLTVKFKSESNTLTTAQTDFIKETETKVYRLLEETPPNGKRFARTVRHMLEREELWNNWKNEGCKEFRKPDEREGATVDDDSKPPPAKRSKRSLGDNLREATRNGRFFLGNDVLTRLWNYSPDNLQACKSEERNFLPQLETYLENPREKSDPSFEWRALRLLARQSPYFFIFTNGSSPCKVADYLENARKRIIKEKIDNAKAAAAVAAAEKESGGKISLTPLSVAESGELETVTQEVDGEMDVEDDNCEIDKVDAEPASDRMEIKPTIEHFEQIAASIGDGWKKLAKKLDIENDVIDYYESVFSETNRACVMMLKNWFDDDDDANLDDLAYTLEGLGLEAASELIKTLVIGLREKQNLPVEMIE